MDDDDVVDEVSVVFEFMMKENIEFERNGTNSLSLSPSLSSTFILFLWQHLLIITEIKLNIFNI